MKNELNTVNKLKNALEKKDKELRLIKERYIKQKKQIIQLKSGTFRGIEEHNNLKRDISPVEQLNRSRRVNNRVIGNYVLNRLKNC